MHSLTPLFCTCQYRVTLSVNDNTIGIIETYDNKEAFDVSAPSE